MDDAHVSVIVDVPVPVAASDAGVVGGVESIVTVVVAVDVPLLLVAVRVYVVVEVGFTFHEPARVDVENDPGVMAMEEAFETFQERTDELAERMGVGEAVNEEMVGVDVLLMAGEAATPHWLSPAEVNGTHISLNRLPGSFASGIMAT